MEHWRSTLTASLDQAIEEGSQRTFVFHPQFIGRSDQKLAIMEEVIELAKQRGMWIAPVREIAQFAADTLLTREMA